MINKYILTLADFEQALNLEQGKQYSYNGECVPHFTIYQELYNFSKQSNEDISIYHLQAIYNFYHGVIIQICIQNNCNTFSEAKRSLEIVLGKVVHPEIFKDMFDNQSIADALNWMYKQCDYNYSGFRVYESVKRIILVQG